MKEAERLCKAVAAASKSGRGLLAPPAVLLEEVPCNFAGERAHLRLPGKRLCPISPRHRYINFAADEVQTETWRDVCNDAQALIAERDTLRADVEATLGQVTTVARLVKLWPEIEPLIPSVAKASRLPALPVKALNDRIGLPPLTG